MEEQILKDFIATAQKYNYDYDVVIPKFPELKGYDLQLLKDYIATAESNNYDYSVVNSKFPELFDVKKKDSESDSEDISSDLFSIQEPFQERLNTINEEAMGLREEPLVQQLNADFNDFGFSFEEDGTGGVDDIRVLAPNSKKTMLSNLLPYAPSATEIFGMADSGGAFKEWMNENMVQDDKAIKDISKSLQSSKPVYRNDEAQIEDLAEFEQSLKDFNSQKDSIVQSKDQIDLMLSQADLSEQETQTLDSLKADYNANIIAFNKRAQVLEVERLKIKRDSVRYLEQKSEQGSLLGSAYNSLLKGGEFVTASALKVLVDIGTAGSYMSLPASGESAISSAQAGETSLLEFQKSFKKDIEESVEGVKDFFDDPNTTEEYINSLTQASYLAAGTLGAIESIPAFAFGLPGLILQTLEYADREMQGPEFDDVSENEKYLYKAPLAVTVGVLERLGFRNIVDSKGLVSKIAFRALRRKGSTKTFAEFVEQDVKNMIARGGLTAIGGALAEAETGALQAVAEVNAKRIWNTARGSKDFETPEAFSKDYYKYVAEQSLLEAIGGFVLGTPTAVKSAKGGFSDKQMNAIMAYKLPLMRDLSKANLHSEMSSGKITKEEYDERVENIDNAADVANSVPDDVNVSTQKQIYRLLQEEAALKKKIGDKDPRFVKTEQKRLDEISSKIDEIMESAERIEPEAAPKATKPGDKVEDVPDRPIAVPEEEEEEDPTATEDVLNRPGTLTEYGGKEFDTPLEGDIYQEGQRVVFESKDGKKYDLGNIDEVRYDSPSNLGFQPQASQVETNEDGTFTVEGEQMNMQEDLPTQGIEYNEDGSIKAVSLVDNDGNTKMYEGSVAEDLAYQIMLNQIQTPEQEQEINEKLEQDAEFKELHEYFVRKKQSRKAEAASEEAAAEDTKESAPGVGSKTEQVETPDGESSTQRVNPVSEEESSKNEAMDKEESKPFEEQAQELDPSGTDLEAKLNELIDKGLITIARAADIRALVKVYGKVLSRYGIKIKLHETEESMGSIDAETAQHIANGFNVEGYFLGKTIHLSPYSLQNKQNKDQNKPQDVVREEFLHAVLRTVIGEHAPTREALFKELKQLKAVNKHYSSVWDKREGDYGRFKNSDRAMYEEEMIMGFLLDYAKNHRKYTKPQRGSLVRLFNKLFKDQGVEKNIITGEEGLLELAEKVRMSLVVGAETEVVEATQKPTGKGRGALSKKPFTYLNGVTVYYTETPYASPTSAYANQYKEEHKMDLPSEKGYNEFRKFYNWKTGNGRNSARIGRMYHIVDGVEKTIKPPKPWLDNDGNPKYMGGAPTPRGYRAMRVRKDENLALEVRLQANAISKEAYDLLQTIPGHTIMQFQDFIPPLEDNMKDSDERRLESFVIAKANVQAFKDMGLTKEELDKIRVSVGGSGSFVIASSQRPDLYNASGLERLHSEESVDQLQDISGIGLELNPEAKEIKGRFAISRKAAIEKTKNGPVKVVSYFGGVPETISWNNWVKKLKTEGVENVFNYTWDQVAASVISFKGSDLKYPLMSGVGEVMSNKDKEQSLGSRDQRTFKSVTNKLYEVYSNLKEGDSGIIATTISVNGVDSILGNPELFKAYVSNLLNLVEKGVIKEDEFLAAFNSAFNSFSDFGEVKKKLSAFQRVRLKSSEPQSSKSKIKEIQRTIEFQRPIYEINAIEDAKFVLKMIAEEGVGTLTGFTRMADILSAKLSGTASVPSVSDLKKAVVQPEYLDKKGKPVPSGTIVAVMTIDVRKLFDGPLVSDINRLDKEEGASFPYALPGLVSIKTLTTFVVAKDSIKLLKSPTKGQTGTRQTTSATPTEMQKGYKEVVIIGGGRGSISRGSTTPKNTDNGTWEQSNRSSLQRGVDLVLQKLQNRYNAVFLLQEDVEKGIGSSVSKDQDFKNNLTRMYGMASNDLEKTEALVKELTDSMKKLGVKIEEIDDYLYALHTPERNALMLERDGVENGSGQTNEEAQEFLDSLSDSKKKALESVAKIVRKIQDDSRKTLVKMGLEPETFIQELEDKFSFYVPLAGLAVDEDLGYYPSGGVGLSITASPIKKAKGRKSKSSNILAQVVSQNTAYKIKGRTNEAVRSLYELIESNPNKEVWYVFDPNAKGTRNLDHPNVVGVRIDGEQKAIYFTDSSYAQTIKDVGVTKLNALGRALRVPAAWLRRAFTTLDPEFILSNFTRDIQSAMFNAAAEAEIPGGVLAGEGITRRMAKLVPSTLKALLKDATNLGEMDPVVAKYIQEWLEFGGKTGWAYQKPLQQLAKDLDSSIQEKNRSQELFGKAENFIGLIEGVNDAVENAIRLASYIAAVEAGVSKEKAAELSKNITVNFNQYGEWGQSLNAIYLFFNASVQGSVRLGRSLLTLKAPKPLSERGTGAVGKAKDAYGRINNAQKLAAGMTLFNSLLTMLNMALSDDDEDGTSFYMKIPDYVKERNVVIMLDGEHYLKIPMPYGYNVFANAGVAMAEVAAGQRGVDSAVMFLGTSAMSSFSPISFGQADNLAEYATKAAVPTVGKPFVESFLTNETYFGGPVYAAQSPYGVRKPSSTMSFRSPESIKRFFSWMNEATGGSDFRSGSVDINPDQYWYLFEYGIGGAGKFWLRGYNTMKDILSDNNVKPEFNDVPIMRRFYGEASKYYDFELYEKNKEDVKQLAKEKEEDPKRSYGRYKGIMKLDVLLKETEKELKALRKESREARKITDYSIRTIKVQRIRDKQRRLIMKYNRRHEQYR